MPHRLHRTRIALGALGQPAAAAPTLTPTKLGVVFADFSRDWHAKAAWDVELTYLMPQADDRDFSIDGLARRVYQANQRGLRVLVRVDYAPGQALPPPDDALALQQFLDGCARLSRDDRLRDVYAFFIGSSYNATGANNGAPARAITPEWYARVFNGYGLPPERADNVVQTMRAIRPGARVLVGPVAPWNPTRTARSPPRTMWHGSIISPRWWHTSTKRRARKGSGLIKADMWYHSKLQKEHGATTDDCTYLPPL